MSLDPRTQRVTPALALFAAALLLSACSDSPTGPDGGQPPANQNPTIAGLSVRESGYRTATVSAAITDADGQVVAARIDWGDGTSTDVAGGFGSVAFSHKYDRAQSYTVTIGATDNAGGTAQLSNSVSITVPPEACIGIEIVEVCARSTADFRNLSVAVRAGEIVLAGFTMSNAQPSITIPLSAGFGRLNLSFNFDTGQLRIAGDVCIVPFLVCIPVAQHVIQF